MRKTIVAGNWKLHGSRAFATGLVGAIASGTPPPEVELVVLPPLPYLGELVAGFGGGPLAFGAQDVSSHQQGAWTGEVAASMLAEAGARYVDAFGGADVVIAKAQGFIDDGDPRFAAELLNGISRQLDKGA